MLAVFVAALVRVIARTWRVQADPLPPGPVVLALLHGDQLSVLGAYLDEEATVAVSQSRDGGLLAEVLADLGKQLLRGSTSRGAVNLLRGGRRALERNERLVFAVDGPRGPVGHVQPGASRLAEAAGCPLVAITASAKPALRLSSWDRFVVPLPFAHLRVRCVECEAETDELGSVLACEP